MHLRTTFDRPSRPRSAWRFTTNELLPSDISNGNADGSRLLSLPPELRNRIYEYTLSLGVIVVSKGGNKHPALRAMARVFSRRDRRNCLALLRANKQIYNEAAKLFYFCNHFEVLAWFPEVVDLEIDDDDDYSHGSSYASEGNIFDLEKRSPRSTMVALYELLQKIGVTSGNAPIHITFELGLIFGPGLEQHSAIAVMQRMLEDLRTIKTTYARMRLDARMDVYIERGDGPHLADTPGPPYTAMLSIPDPLPSISTFIARLSGMIAQNSAREVHDEEDLEDFDRFFRGLRQSIETSPNW
ncbi:hypothetical protein LTR15_006685 [Elasticomyces elasticus]|nr:hypothetical protein LTR15_006685 [Elasticomyces elasticus]